MAYILNRRAILRNDDNSSCPIMLILVNAICHGNVEGNTIEEILAYAAIHSLQRIGWVNPDVPAICHVTSAYIVARNKPMKSASWIFKLITSIVNSNTLIGSHDLRHGTAKDLLNIVRDQHMELLDISEELNHNGASANGNLTKRYTEKHSTQDTWPERVNLHENLEAYNNFSIYKVSAWKFM
jgi:hypothetical protein